MEWCNESIIIKNECHTLGNLLQKYLCQKEVVTFVSYRKKDADIELFLTTKNNCLEEKKKVFLEVLNNIDEKINDLNKKIIPIKKN